MPKSVNNSTIQQALAEAAAGVALRSVTKKYSAVTAVENHLRYYCRNLLLFIGAQWLRKNDSDKNGCGT